MMTATDELRKLLDERGVECIENYFGITWSYYADPHMAAESMDGSLIVSGLTPEQAIAATLQGDREAELEADVGDAVTILLMAAKGGFEGSTGNVMKNAKALLNMPKERALDSEVFRVLADMVERERADLTAENERLLDVTHKQAESFKGIEAELAAANSTCNTLRASVAGLKATVDRFNARDGSGRGNPGT